MSDCLFCSIIAGDQPSDRVYEDDHLVAFRDIYPRAPIHVLVVPREHLPSAHHLEDDHAHLIARCFLAAQRIAEAEGTSDGYRVATNVGRRGGQMIDHLHFHVIGGRQLGHIDSGNPTA